MGISESTLLDMAKEDVAEVRKKECTVEFLKTEAPLIKASVELIDISNIFLGPHTSLAMNKIEDCLKVLEENVEKIPESIKMKLIKKLSKMRVIFEMKLRYGKKVDEYLRKREASLVEIIKDRVLDTDIDKYDKIMKKMTFFKADLLKRAEDVCLVIGQLK